MKFIFATHKLIYSLFNSGTSIANTHGWATKLAPTEQQSLCKKASRHNDHVDQCSSAHGLRDRSEKSTVSKANEDLQRIARTAVDVCTTAHSPKKSLKNSYDLRYPEAITTFCLLMVL